MRGALPLTALLMLGACADGGSHETIHRDFPVTGSFQKVSLAGSTDVVVTVGGAVSVRAEGDKAVIDRLDIHVENGELTIGTKRNGGFSWNFSGHRRTVVYVTMPSLAGASIAGSGDMKIDKVAGNDLDATVGGSGDMNIASLQVTQARFNIAGSGDIEASGKAQQANVTVAGSGDFKAGGLEIGNATVSVIGSGDITARATQSADVTIMGSGDVTLSGPAKCTVHKMGSGDVHCGS